MLIDGTQSTHICLALRECGNVHVDGRVCVLLAAHHGRVCASVEGKWLVSWREPKPVDVGQFAAYEQGARATAIREKSRRISFVGFDASFETNDAIVIIRNDPGGPIERDTDGKWILHTPYVPRAGTVYRSKRFAGVGTLP